MPELILKSLLVYSPDSDMGFHTEFSKSVNIVHGRNTSGKSTLIQSIIYTMGINDSKDNLNDINKSDVFFRLDCELHEGNSISKLIFVRSDETLILKKGDSCPTRFDGINGNNSIEHGRYKKILSEIIGFNLVLQKQSELVEAPLEAALLPYYISQSVGWVYIRESIGDYRYYKDFKFDYLDYYCGVENSHDRIKKYKLEAEKRELTFELKQLNSYEANNESFKISTILNDRFKGQAVDFLAEHEASNNDLSTKEAEHTKLCNKIGMLRSRQKVLSQIIKNIETQRPKIDQCPTCDQDLPGDLKEIYLYNQNINDAIKERESTKEHIKLNVSKLNSLEKSLSALRIKANKDFSVLRRLQLENVTFDSWLQHNANLELLKSVSIQRSACERKIANLGRDIESIGDGVDIESERRNKEKEFLAIFKTKAASMGVKLPSERKHQDLYSLNSFPYQGVELHLLLMAYNFSFYEMVMNNPNIHRFPFLLDAVFKEDIEISSRSEIFAFLSRETKNSGQVVFSVAEYKGNSTKLDPLFDIESIKSEFFPSDTKLICIGDSKTKRSFLSSSPLIDTALIEETIELLETV